jgi:hypothetical protein
MNIHREMFLEKVLYFVVDQRVEISTEGSSHTRRSYHVLEYQIPADHERQKLANSNVSVDISAACFGHSSAKLRIAKSYIKNRFKIVISISRFSTSLLTGQHGSDSSNQKRQNHSWTSLLFDHRASEHINACSKSASDTSNPQKIFILSEFIGEKKNF